MYQVRDHNAELIMIAPMETIRQVFNLHRDAVKRIETETAVNEGRGICNLHFNNRPTAVATSGSVQIGRFDEGRLS